MQSIQKVDASAVPVLYDKALAALYECQKVDDAKAFTDSAEALAVWAKIYKRNDVAREAKQLRLHAFRRMARLARELSPRTGLANGGSEPGPVALLRKHGLTRHQADAANHLAKIGGAEFGSFVNSDSPPAPTTIAKKYRRMATLTPWVMLRERPRTPFACSGYIQNNRPEAVAAMMTGEEIQAAKKLAEDLTLWLQRFNKALRHD